MHVLLKTLSSCTGARPQQPDQPSQKKWRFQQARFIFARHHYQQIIELHRIQWKVPARFSSLTNPESRTPESTINIHQLVWCFEVSLSKRLSSQVKADWFAWTHTLTQSLVQHKHEHVWSMEIVTMKLLWTSEYAPFFSSLSCAIALASFGLIRCTL